MLPLNRAKILRLVAAAAMAALAIAPQAIGNTPDEYRVKAAYLLNFLRLTEWPETAENKGAFVIGVLGADPFGDVLEQTINGKTVRGRPISVRKYRSIHDVENCRLLFFSSSEANRLHLDFDRLPNASILTVGDVDGFLESGGAVYFVMADSKVRFDVNLEAVSAAHLKLDAQLLAVARRVHGRVK